MKPELTQKELKEVLHYNPETGIFTRTKRTSKSVQIGDIAGCDYSSGKDRKNKYRLISVKNNQYRAHRLAFLYMTGKWPNDQTDHIDGNGLNNKWENLREVNNIENHKNRLMQANNTSGCVGVVWFKRDSKWHAQIKINQKNIHLGYYLDINDAIAAREAANIKYGFHPNHGQKRPL